MKMGSIKRKVFIGATVFTLVLMFIMLVVSYSACRDLAFGVYGVSVEITADNLSEDDDVQAYTRVLAKDVMDVYNSDAEVKDYSSVMQSDAYLNLIKYLNSFRKTNSIKYLTVVSVDEEKGVYVFLADADAYENLTGSVSYPGDSWQLTEEELDLYREHQVVLPAHVTNMDKHEDYLCSAASAVRGVDGKPVAFVVADLSLTEMQEGARQSTILYAPYLIAIIFAMGMIAVFLAGHYLIQPLETITTASNRFIKNRKNNEEGPTSFFSNLQVEAGGEEIVQLSQSLSILESQLNEYITNLKEVTEENARIHTELSLASKIQSSMLPDIPDSDKYDIYAMMLPAREVGGDFYDFIELDDTHVALVVADASGKGVPASLVVTNVKARIHSLVYTMSTPGEVLHALNNIICKDNTMNMFVTMWLGYVDLANGTLIYANAGHENPALFQNGEWNYRKEKHGLVLGGIENMTYENFTVQLEAGDMIFQYSDGITEAQNIEGEQFKAEGLMNVLKETNTSRSLNVVDRVTERILEFEDGTEQFDDITMLCFQYKDVKTAVFEANKENLDKVIEFVDENIHCSMKTQMQINLAVEEIFVNIACYAYGDNQGTVTVKVANYKNEAEITFMDSGIPFDPLQKEDPDVHLSSEERQIGGLGIFITKNIMDEIRYEYKNDMNQLYMRKCFDKIGTSKDIH